MQHGSTISCSIVYIEDNTRTASLFVVSATMAVKSTSVTRFNSKEGLLLARYASIYLGSVHGPTVITVLIYLHAYHPQPC
jgi:hypothetical protein